MREQRRVLIVDLNNFARYPTVAVGYLVAVLRQAGMHVDVLSPLGHGISGVARESRPRPWHRLEQQLRYATAVSRTPSVRWMRERLVEAARPMRGRAADRIAALVSGALAETGCEAVLVSTYLMYYDVCRRIVAQCHEAGVPVLIGGAYFSQPEVSRAWLEVGPVAGIAGGEMEPVLADIVEAMAQGERLAGRDGIWTHERPDVRPAAPLLELDAVPYPDYADFPWGRYPHRIVPVITGRGCGWGACRFCSDVTSSAGRTFRSRRPDAVLAELEHQAATYDTSLFTFTDLKLNSDLAVWSALLEELPARLPDARWVAAVHVGANGPNGLDRDGLRAAARAGMTRLTTGIESGSQRVLDAMAKGTELGRTSRALRDATEAGISVRVTVIVGYPGETASDVRATARFLSEHESCIERVTVNRFSLMVGTGVHRRGQPASVNGNGLVPLTVNHREAFIEHHNRATESGAYRRGVYAVLAAAHRINRRPLRHTAREFDGIM